MARARTQEERQEAGQDRVTELARELYLSLVIASSAKTLEHSAKEAFEKAEAFYAYADSRKNKEGEDL